MNMDMTSTMPVLPVTASSGGMGGMFGNGGDWTVFLLFALIFGWGGNGLGGFGGRGAGAVAENSYISNEFNYSNLSNGIRAIQNGLCDSTYALNSSIGSQGELTRGAVTSGFVDTQRSFYDLASRVDSCCCETNRNLDSIKYENAKNTCDIITNANMNTRDLIEAGNANTQRIVDMMTQNTIQELRDKNTALTLQVSQIAQTQSIVDQLKPCPRPAYIVSNPYCGA